MIYRQRVKLSWQDLYKVRVKTSNTLTNSLIFENLFPGFSDVTFAISSFRSWLIFQSLTFCPLTIRQNSIGKYSVSPTCKHGRWGYLVSRNHSAKIVCLEIIMNYWYQTLPQTFIVSYWYGWAISSVIVRKFMLGQVEHLIDDILLDVFLSSATTDKITENKVLFLFTVIPPYQFQLLKCI